MLRHYAATKQKASFMGTVEASLVECHNLLSSCAGNNGITSLAHEREGGQGAGAVVES